jgi:hypothetical protein
MKTLWRNAASFPIRDRIEEIGAGIGPVQGSCRRKLRRIIEGKVTVVKKNM